MDLGRSWRIALAKYKIKQMLTNGIGQLERITLRILDWVTCGRALHELSDSSCWQKGPDFLKLSPQEWPVLQNTNVESLPERSKANITATVNETETLAK